MGGEFVEETDMEVDMEILPSMWPEDLGDGTRKQFNIDKPGMDQDMLQNVEIEADPSAVDFKRLVELTNYSEKGSSQLTYLVKNWEYKQANAVRLLNEELNILNRQREEAELKKLEILEDYRFEEEKHAGDKRSISILDDDLWEAVPRRRNDVFPSHKKIDIDAGYDTIKYWKQRAMQLDKMLEASNQREQALIKQLQKNVKNLETESSPVEELSQILKRADNFLHFILQTAPVVIGHQDKELRYRFIYNHFPRLGEEEIIGKTDTEIFSGAGVKEIQEFKKEVLERGKSAKREITFETPLFGLKTFLIYVEPVFSKAGETIGINYMGMDVTDQVTKRERMAKLREEIAVQKAKETELNKTIHITEETMRAKQMLATMSHEIRSPLTGVVSMAEILANSKLDKEQRQLLDVMLSSGDLVLQLINDILDLSKVESGYDNHLGVSPCEILHELDHGVKFITGVGLIHLEGFEIYQSYFCLLKPFSKHDTGTSGLELYGLGVMKLEAAKFRPREVVKHVLQTAAAALQKELTLEGHIADNVPIEVIGDVLRIRQILTNLISNAIKFTHEGKVGVKLHVVSEHFPGRGGKNDQVPAAEDSSFPTTGVSEENAAESQSYDDTEKNHQSYEKIVLIRCDVYDTGIGIPEKALPSLFKKYMQASTDHARKYGGTGLGLAICKQLVELMGGQLTVTSQERCGSTFTFVLPYKVPSKREISDDEDEASAVSDHEVLADASADEISGSFIFKPRTLGTLFSSGGSMVRKTKVFGTNMFNALHTTNGLQQESDLFSSNGCMARDQALVEEISSVPDAIDTPNEVHQHDLNCNGAATAKRNEDQQGDTDNFLRNAGSSSGMESRSSQGSRSSGHSTKKSTEVANKVTCQSQSHGNLKIRSPSDESSESSKLDLQPKILLVEDNKINVMVAQSMMKRLGHSIKVVSNGLEAIHAVQRSHYDLILMDVCMPVMDGLQATRLIRSFEEHGYWDESVRVGDDDTMPHLDSPPSGPNAGQCGKRIPIIAMTANSLAESADDCLANGMDTFVSKPVTFQKLKQCLQQYIPC